MSVCWVIFKAAILVERIVMESLLKHYYHALKYRLLDGIMWYHLTEIKQPF